MTATLLDPELKETAGLENRLRVLFSSDEAFAEWLERPLEVFGNRTAKALLEKEPVLLEEMLEEFEAAEYV